MLFTLTQFSFAQNANQIESMNGVRGVALRTYCSFSALFRAENSKCFNATRSGAVSSTASIGAIDIPSTNSPATPVAPAQTPVASIVGGFPVQTSAPQVIERTVIVQGTPGPQGPAGRDGQSIFGPLPNTPTAFWGGGGVSVSSAPSSGSSIPLGGLPGQVLTTNASGTLEWQFITLPSASNTPLVFGSLSNVFTENGLTLATTSTSTALRLGGSLTEDTKIAQDMFNFSLDRQGFGFINQGTTSVPIAGFTIENQRFVGLRAEEGTHSLFAGIVRRSAPPVPLFEVQAFDSNLGRQGFSSVGSGASQIGVSNGTTTNQIRSDFNRIRLSSVTASGSSTQITVDANGVHFGFDGNATSGGGKTYSFPRVDGVFDAFMATDGSGKVRFRTLQEVFASTSTSTLAILPVWSTSGNTGINPDVNFIGTLDANDFSVRTNNVERFRVTSNGNVGIGTSTPAQLFTVVNLANGANPLALFHGGTQTYARFVNGSGAFPQSYSVGVEAVGGTFNVIDTNANKTRLSINRNGGVQIYDRLAVGSYDFGLGNTGDAGFGRSDQAYMRYVQRAHIADPALELYDYNSQLSTRISQSSNGTPTEFNRTQRDIDFRIYGQADQNLFFADAMLNKVGIGMAPIATQPANKLEVAGNISVRTGDRVVFENSTFADWITSAPGFNGRSLQFWTASNKRMEIDGSGNVLWNENGTGNRTFQFRPSNGQTSDVIRMQQNPNQGTATLFSVNGLGGGYFAGNVGIGITNPSFALESVITSTGNNGFQQTSTNPSALGLVRLRNDTGAISQVSVYGSSHFLPELRNNGGVGASNSFYIYSNSEMPTGGNGSIHFMTGGWTPSTQTRMTIDSLGNVGVGVVSPTHRLHVVGGTTGLINGRVARFDNASATCYINPTSLLGIQCSSDRTLKKDITSMDTTLAQLTQLKPSLFRWNADDASSSLQYGFIAQEIEEVFPSFVTTDSDTGMKSVAFGNLIPVTVKSIQEINAALGDVTEKGTTDSFIASAIFKKITDAFMAVTVEFRSIFVKKATVEELCLSTSSGTPVCLSGDDVVTILGHVGAQHTSTNIDSSEDAVQGSPDGGPTPVTGKVVNSNGDKELTTEDDGGAFQTDELEVIVSDDGE